MENLRKEQEIKFETTKIKMVPVFYKNQNPETLEGCPNFSEKLVKREEEVLILTKCHPGHKCEYSFQIVLYVNWNGVEAEYVLL